MMNMNKIRNETFSVTYGSENSVLIKHTVKAATCHAFRLGTTFSAQQFFAIKCADTVVVMRDGAPERHRQRSAGRERQLTGVGNVRVTLQAVVRDHLFGGSRSLFYAGHCSGALVWCALHADACSRAATTLGAIDDKVAMEVRALYIYHP